MTGSVSIIYGLFDPRDGALRYVGKTARHAIRKGRPVNGLSLRWAE